MKKKLLTLATLLLSFSLLFAFISCGESETGTTNTDGGTGDITETPSPDSGTEKPGDEKPTPTPEKRLVRIAVRVTEGFSVVGLSNIEIEEGSDATFEIKLDEGYGFKSVSHGTYDPITGILTVPSVTERTFVEFEVEVLSYDTTETYSYIFKGTDKDTTSVEPSKAVNAGTLIKVAAGDRSKRFDGWSFGRALKKGDTPVSTDREFEFRLTPDIVTDGVLILYPNYSDSNVYYYDANGGYINTDTFNMSIDAAEKEYYEALAIGNKIKVTLLGKYYEFAECASTFYDDGTFERDGYLLTEYNTKPDGTGESYSLGSKFFTVGEDDEAPTLYCIWMKAEDESSFTYSDHTMQNPAKKPEYAPEWRESGVVIKSYTGSAKTLVIPEYIDGKPVIAIKDGAFVNCEFETLVLPKTMQQITDGAFVGCKNLTTLYYPSSIYNISDRAFDSATYEGFAHLYVNQTMAPRYTQSTEGAFAVKLSRFLASLDDKQIIIISGSSTYQSHGTEYMEALFSGEYTVINFGTTRPRPGMIYLEALSHYTDSDDIFVYAPENSAFMYGEKYISWRMIRDLEGMNNLFRYFDVSNYEGYFSSFSELNKSYNYTVEPKRFEDICINGNQNYFTDKNGDYQNVNRQTMGYEKYIDSYYITFNNRVKSITGPDWNDVEAQAKDKDYTDPNNTTWASIDTPERIAKLNMAIDKAKASGARVFFGFAPSDANAVVAEARNTEWLDAYDRLISDIYNFDGLVGSSKNYIFDHAYFYDCAFHTNDYGRTYRTYIMYKDLCEILGIEAKGIYSVGDSFDGCLFETDSDGTPNIKVDFLQ